MDGDGARTLVLVVGDTGCGIDPAQAEALFQPFTQADASTSRKYGGTGLGLALARYLARALGGDVRLDRSAPGRGSVFRVTIDLGDGMAAASPTAAASDAREAPRPADTARQELALGSLAPRSTDRPIAPSSPSTLRHCRILVVDDTPDIRQLLEETLARHGAEVDTACDGRQGIAMAVENRYDVVLMDIQLPELDGYAATRRLRAAGLDCAVIALTGRAAKDEAAACRAAGFNGYLAKPVSLTDLVATVADWCARRRGAAARPATTTESDVSG